MKFSEIEYIIKTVLKTAEIESSSDFVCAAYQINSKICSKFAQRIEPILEIEIDNCHDDWVSNVCFSEGLLAGSSASRYTVMADAYRAALDFLLLHEYVAAVFPMDERDHIGWKIYKELDTKYKHCKTFAERLSYVQSK